MTGKQMALLALAAVLMFWVVGAYNRLVALRNAIAEAWAKVDEALRQRRAAVEPLLDALHAPLAAEHGALDALQTALRDNATAAAAMAARPVEQARAQAWVAAESALSAAASRVFSLLEQNAELRQQEPVATQVLAWLEASKRLSFARQLFNETALPYDEAVRTFPTRLLVGLFRFRGAGRL